MRIPDDTVPVAPGFETAAFESSEAPVPERVSAPPVSAAPAPERVLAPPRPAPALPPRPTPAAALQAQAAPAPSPAAETSDVLQPMRIINIGSPEPSKVEAIAAAALPVPPTSAPELIAKEESEGEIDSSWTPLPPPVSKLEAKSSKPLSVPPPAPAVKAADTQAIDESGWTPVVSKAEVVAAEERATSAAREEEREEQEEQPAEQESALAGAEESRPSGEGLDVDVEADMELPEAEAAPRETPEVIPEPAAAKEEPESLEELLEAPEEIAESAPAEQPVSLPKKPPPPPPPPKRPPAPPPPPPAAPAASAAPAAASTPPPLSADAKRKRQKPWWEELFGDDFIRTLDKPVRKIIRREVDFIEESLGVEKGAVILDLACGPGSHAVELASRGYSVVGYDLSLAMLARAADEAQERNQKLNFLQGDMREMAFEEMFDGVYCWSTSFGFFDEEKNLNVLQRTNRALRQGGLLLLDILNRDYVASRQPSLVWFEGEGCVCIDEMHLDFYTSRLRVKRTAMFDDGRSREVDYSIRLYALHEVGKLLHDSGFKVIEVTGNLAHRGVFFGADSPRIVVLAERT